MQTIAAARREFLRERSPRILFAGVGIALALRVAVGDFGWRDLAAVALMMPVYALGEWAIHVHLLHLPPFRWRGREVELITAKGHRQHHEDPNNLNLIVLGIVESLVLYLVAVPLVVGSGCLLIGLVFGPVPLPAALTAGLTAYVLILAYEWVHFLIHTGVRPRSRYYRAIWRGHRLHHFKNERYWHGITNTVSDRVLGTAPDQRSVPRSPTARTLRP